MFGTLSKEQRDGFELSFRPGTCFRITNTNAESDTAIGLRNIPFSAFSVLERISNIAVTVPVFGGGRRGRSLVPVRWTGSRMSTIELMRLKPRFILAVVQNWTALSSVDCLLGSTLCTCFPRMQAALICRQRKFITLWQETIKSSGASFKTPSSSPLVSQSILNIQASCPVRRWPRQEKDRILWTNKSSETTTHGFDVETPPCSLPQTLPMP